jgi:hypothetical protein
MENNFQSVAEPMIFHVQPLAAPNIDFKTVKSNVMDVIFIYIFILIIIITIVNTGVNHVMCKKEWDFSSKVGVNVGMYAIPTLISYALLKRKN